MARITTGAIVASATALQEGDINGALAVRDAEYHQACSAFDDVVSRRVELMLSHTPQLLRDCPSAILEPLRVTAALMELWGVSSIRQFVTIEGESDYRFDPPAIANMLHSHGCYLQKLEDLRRLGFLLVRLQGSGHSDDCEVCLAADGMSFSIDTVPELPLTTCSCKTGYGCRVIMLAVA
jgi:hypothetical protein